jgi:hypothetical protein
LHKIWASQPLKDGQRQYATVDDLPSEMKSLAERTTSAKVGAKYASNKAAEPEEDEEE